jgi:hypothetical protein
VGSNRVLFVADGAGDYGVTTDNVRQVVREQKLPWCVEKVVWSHGKLRVYADQTDVANSRAAGHCLPSASGPIARERLRYLDVAHSARLRGRAGALENSAGQCDHALLLTPSCPRSTTSAGAAGDARGIDVSTA